MVTETSQFSWDHLAMIEFNRAISSNSPNGSSWKYLVIYCNAYLVACNLPQNSGGRMQKQEFHGFWRYDHYCDQSYLS